MPHIDAWCRKCYRVTTHVLHLGNTTNVIGKCLTCGEHHGAASPNYKPKGA